MRKKINTIPFGVIAALVVFSFAAQTEETASVVVRVQGEGAGELLKKLNEHGKEKGLHFTYGSPYSFRIATDKARDFWGQAKAQAAVLDAECNLLFIVSREGRWTEGGAMNAVAKEIVKQLAPLVKSK